MELESSVCGWLVGRRERAAVAGLGRSGCGAWGGQMASGQAWDTAGRREGAVVAELVRSGYRASASQCAGREVAGGRKQQGLRAVAAGGGIEALASPPPGSRWLVGSSDSMPLPEPHHNCCYCFCFVTW